MSDDRSVAESMRVSPGGLLVLLGFSVPVIVELRTLLGMFGVDVSPVTAVVAGLTLVFAIVCWALSPAVSETLRHRCARG